MKSVCALLDQKKNYTAYTLQHKIPQHSLYVIYLIKFEGKGLQVVSVHALPGLRELQRHLVGEEEYYTC